MTTDERAARLAAIAERAAAATPGPWRWRGNLTAKGIELRSIARGRCTVMDFVRWGMQAATPRFIDAEKIMRRPRLIPSAPHNAWDIVAIDHPDARFIEHSRADIDFLLGEVGTLRAALAALVADDFNAWAWNSYESQWRCHWCHAEGADISDEPRVRDHAEGCPWLAARALVGYAVPSEEEGDGG